MPPTGTACRSLDCCSVLLHLQDLQSRSCRVKQNSTQCLLSVPWTYCTEMSETLSHHLSATVVDPGLSRRGHRSSRHPWICQCIGVQPFLNSSELSTISCCRKYFSRISQMVQELDTYTNRRYWRQYRFHYTVAAWVPVITSSCMVWLASTEVCTLCGLFIMTLFLHVDTKTIHYQQNTYAYCHSLYGGTSWCISHCPK